MRENKIDAYDVLDNVFPNKNRWVKISHLSAEKQKLIKKIAALKNKPEPVNSPCPL